MLSKMRRQNVRKRYLVPITLGILTVILLSPLTALAAVDWYDPDEPFLWTDGHYSDGYWEDYLGPFSYQLDVIHEFSDVPQDADKYELYIDYDYNGYHIESFLVYYRWGSSGGWTLFRVYNPIDDFDDIQEISDPTSTLLQVRFMDGRGILDFGADVWTVDLFLKITS